MLLIFSLKLLTLSDMAYQYLMDPWGRGPSRPPTILLHFMGLQASIQFMLSLVWWVRSLFSLRNNKQDFYEKFIMYNIEGSILSYFQSLAQNLFVVRFNIKVLICLNCLYILYVLKKSNTFYKIFFISKIYLLLHSLISTSIIYIFDNFGNGMDHACNHWTNFLKAKSLIIDREYLMGRTIVRRLFEVKLF